MRRFRHKRFFHLTAIFLLMQGAACRTDPQLPWAGSLGEAQAQSAASGKELIIVYAYTDWCGWCKRMDATTWTHPEVMQQAGAYVFLKLNTEKDPDGMALRGRFRVESYPTVLLLDAKGEEFERLEGYLTGEQFLAKLNEIRRDPESLGNLRGRERTVPEDLGSRYRLGKKLYERRLLSEARSRFQNVSDLDRKNESGVADLSLYYLALCQAGENDSDGSLATIDRLRTTFPQSGIGGDAYLLSSRILLRTGRREKARARILDFLDAYPSHRLAPEARKLLAEL